MTTPKMETPRQHEITEHVSCLPESAACVANNDPRASRRAELKEGKLNFSVYTWGNIQTIHPVDLTVDKLLTAYFGYVAAKVK
jgi:hypothetical protein